MLQTIRSRINRRFTRAGVIALALVESVLITGAVFTSTANAAASDCNYSSGDGQIACFWYDINYSGLRTDYYSPGLNVCHNFSSTFNDQISSVYNKTPYKLRMYADSGCSWTYMTVSPNSYTNLPSINNDWASSFKLITVDTW